MRRSARRPTDAADLLTVVNACVSEQTGTSGRRRYSPRLVRALILALYAYPILHVLAVCGLAVPLMVLGTRPLVDRTGALLAQIAALEPTWTGTINYAALLPLAPGTQAVLSAADQYSRWMRATYGLYCVRQSTLTALTQQIWIPASVIHLRQFYKQVQRLRGTVRALSGQRATASAQSAGVEFRKDDAERRMRALLNICWARIIVLVCARGDQNDRADSAGITIALSLFVADALVVATDPRALVTSRVRGAFTAVSTCAYDLPPLLRSSSQISLQSVTGPLWSS